MRNRGILYLECASGISGDMTVAALLDLGADKNVLLKALKSLDIVGYEIKIDEVEKCGVKACNFTVVLDKEHENHDHDMDYLHGNESCQEHHHHSHTTLKEIIHIIDNSEITENAKKIALKIFDILGDAEAKAHGVSKEDVTFHEVGAVDSIVDIVSVAVCVDNLGIEKVVVPKLCEGTGFVRCQHGLLPIPVPAVLNIVSKYGIKLQITQTQGEFVTPTGAAVAAALMTSDVLPESFRIIKTGIGAGKRNYEMPSLLRAMLIDECKGDDIYKLETNIDDCTGEEMGLVMEMLFKAGANDVSYIPVFMKKNRPAYQLNVICKASDVETIEKIIFENTTTIGIRKYKTERDILPRKSITVDCMGDFVDVKVCTLPGGKCKFYPEYESIRRICEKYGVSYREAYSKAVMLCAEKSEFNEKL